MTSDVDTYGSSELKPKPNKIDIGIAYLGELIVSSILLSILYSVATLKTDEKIKINDIINSNTLIYFKKHLLLPLN